MLLLNRKVLYQITKAAHAAFVVLRLVFFDYFVTELY